MGAEKVEPRAKHEEIGEEQCSGTSQLKAIFEKYASVESLASLQTEAARRLIYAGGSLFELSERLARDDLRLPPGNALEAAHWTGATGLPNGAQSHAALHNAGVSAAE